MQQPDKLDHLLKVLRDHAFRQIEGDIPLRWRQAAPEDRAQMADGPGANWKEMTPDTIWGEPQSYFWFGGQAVIPDELAGKRVYLWIDAQFGRVMGRSDPQCLVRVNGKITQGADFNHREVLLSDCAEAGARYDVLIEAGTIEDRRQAGFACWLMVHDAAAEQLYYDLQVPLDVARHLPETDHRRDLILTTVYEALNAVDMRAGNPERFAASLEAARAIADRIYATVDTEAQPKITVTGHTHIDVAWLWRVRETRQKMARSMATALTLMGEYPDYKFMYNQGYLLDTLAQDYPALFDGLKAAQDRGQFEIEGALWLEPDANMASGESLVRQILKGVRYHQKVFGVRPKIVWLPDTFGYPAALPQIMKLAGLEVFVTHKMSWNDTNRIPNESFWWEGLDGTRVPTYFLTTQPVTSDELGTTYCPDLKATHVLGAWRRYAQKGTNDELFLVYGHGDGGGGPTREMLEHIRRMERGIPGLPTVEHGAMAPFFDRLVERMQADPARYPAWVGELYLEFHRGTFTSVAKVKRNNRRAEADLREIEALASLADTRGAFAYPQERIAKLWDILLLNQFHDILPGSSIGLVYDDSDAEFAAFFAAADALRAELAGALAGEGELLLANPLGHSRDGLVQVESDAPIALDGAPSQTLHRADGRVVQAAPVAPVPALAAARAQLGESGPAEGAGGLVVTANILENAHLRAAFDENGRLVSLYDKCSHREVLAGAANRLQAFRDLPEQFDAWDIDTTFEDQLWEIDDLISAEVVETGPYRAAIRM
ncbi:MAG: glycoside hydrolase family 38 C-terminal domain-containing protein, partial [Maritimibacter sp.]